MKKLVCSIALLGCVVAGNGQAAVPKGWFVAGTTPSAYEMGTQPGIRGANDNNAFIRSKNETRGFGTLMQTISAKAYRGRRVRFSGFLHTRDADKAGLWMRIDGADKQIVGFDNMEQRSLHGNNDWQNYNIVLDVPEEAADIAFGVLLSGKGEVLADDFKLDVVGNDVVPTGMPLRQLPGVPTNLSFSP
ncbi:hypothetical protein [Rhodanobacter sp. L36]|uniref:hypothetical protein n=1 Tax=Rhodanobacter sp. L36 TaxID=1747221 RepID=UPI00131E916A|nr:hypothetical protein [Rhodanobacter sp. L36]